MCIQKHNRDQFELNFMWPAIVVKKNLVHCVQRMANIIQQSIDNIHKKFEKIKVVWEFKGKVIWTSSEESKIVKWAHTNPNQTVQFLSSTQVGNKINKTKSNEPVKKRSSERNVGDVRSDWVWERGGAIVVSRGWGESEEEACGFGSWLKRKAEKKWEIDRERGGRRRGDRLP